ncbi:MAG: nitronate monooxygenase [Deltaproteobacteria bacterium]|nr:nitronate monooxygenase [Deltaproteobacteria bacterium]
MKTPICEKLGIEYPIFAFSHCRDVVAAVSKAGGLGVLGAVAFSPEELERELVWIDEHVDGKPYGVDTVMPAAYLGKDQGDLGKIDLQAMIPDEHKEFIKGLLERYGVPELPAGQNAWESLLGWSVSAGRAHVEIAMKHPIKLLANALGPPPEDVVERAHSAGVLVAALCGSVDQAVKQKEAGVDIVVASGYEAGGHTGDISSLVLVPQVVDAVAPTPVLAAGGIGSGRQMAAALVLGASGVWTGSLWLATAESDCVPALKEKLIAATSRDTVRSKCISGKPARQLKTAWTDAWDGADSPGTLPMPLQWMATSEALTRIYQHAQTRKPGSAQLLGTPVGQIVGQISQMKPAREVVRELVEGSLDAVERASQILGLSDAD